MCAPTHIRYRFSELLQHKRGSGYPPSDVIQRLKALNLYHNRAKRGGKRVVRPIPVHTTAKRKETKVKVKEYKHLEVPRVWYSLPSVLLSNVTSLTNKMDEVIVAVRSTSADIVAITEAWQIVPEVCSIDNYELFHHLRTDRRGGGVALFCRSDLSPTSHLDVIIPPGVECLWVRVTPPCHPRHTASVIVCVVYHPPRADTAQTLIEHIIETADDLRVKYPAAKLIVCGDFNRLDVSDISSHLNLTQVVEFATHDQATLDLILTDLGAQYTPPQPLPPMGRSTHLSILWEPAPTTSMPKVALTKTLRPMPDSAIREFGQWIVHHPWTEVTEVEDVHTKWQNFVTTTTDAYQRFFPAKSIPVHPADAPWLTPRVKRLIRQRNRAFYADTVLYRRLRNKVIREIRTAKARYYPDKIHHLKTANNKQWFSKIKTLCGLQKQTPGFPCASHLQADTAADQINAHFSAICQTFPPLNLNLLPAYLPSPSPPPAVQEAEIVTKLRKFKSNRATTPTDLPMKLYKEFAPELATPLCSIINASLSQSSCPSDWKTAYVTPLPKTPNPQTFNDLRPVAITPIPSLLCEDFVFNWAYSQISNSIDLQQFGNMKSCSTAHCLVSFLEFIHSHLDKRNTSLAVAFVDFRKAFDLVDHSVVINKAISLGLQPSLVAWLADFLHGRKQAVRYQGCVSPLQHLTCGVPQGTKSGPLLFLLLINDALTKSPNRWKYVDDCTLGVPVNNRDPDYAPLQEALNELQAWTEVNNMAINHTKTVVMHLCTSTTAVPPPQVSIGPHPLQVVHSAKLLGVILDDKLNWKQHVDSIVRAASFKIYMLRRLRSLGTPVDELRGVYTTFILPKLMYASPSWSSSLNLSQQNQLEKVQRRACRVILGPAYVSYEDALTTLTLRKLSAEHNDALRKFAEGLMHHPRHRHLLPPAAAPARPTRHQNRVKPLKAPRTDRYHNSAIPTMVRMINS